MNLTLDFDVPEPLALHPAHSAAPLAARFMEAMQQDGSPVRAVRHQPARAARYGAFPESLNPLLRGALASRGIENLYTHQAAAVELSLSGKNVVVVTPTASGKTLCYNLPVIHEILAIPAARAIFLFPTTALAEDQRLELALLPHLRWRHSLRRPPHHSRQSQHRHDEPGHAPHRHSSAPHQMGQAL